MRRLFSMGLLVAGALIGTLPITSSAIAQEVAITGKDFLSGGGDAKLAEMGREAAATGRVVVITAPKYWQDKAAAKVHAGSAAARVTTSEGFFENVVVRFGDAKAVAPKPDAAPADAAKADTARADAAKAAAAKADAAKADAARIETERADAARAEAARADAAKAEAARAEAARAEAAKAEAARAEAAKAEAARAEAAKAEAAKVAAVKAAQDDITQRQKRLEQNVNNGKAAEGTIVQTQLQKDDLLFVDGPVRGVVRRLGAHTQLFWLDGDLNLDRTELLPNGPNRYKVAEPILNANNPTLRGSKSGTQQQFAAAVPAANSDVRKSLLGQYGEGKPVDATLAISDLRQGDLIYTGNGAAIVVRRSATGLDRYWLVGEIDLHQSGLQQNGGNAYRALTDNIK